MKTSILSIILMVLCTAFTSAGQILWKLGVQQMTDPVSIWSVLTNLPLISGFVSYGLGAVLLILALRGGELSVLYPIVATSYVWVAMLSTIFIGESMNPWKWTGIFVIIAGVVLVTTHERINGRIRKRSKGEAMEAIAV
ncbi:EamA family transporter [Candidatus Woesearchaeota archaeon]|nr:EamA family transporter [Candidatus Woesearchaeota archaeon]